MKKTVLALSIATALVACNQAENASQSSAATTDITATADSDTFGESFAAENVISTSALQEMAIGKDSVQAVVTAEVLESCQSKGCWMDVKLPDNNTMKVTFRDYGFFLPVEDLKGRTVIFTGTAKREEISVADQRHYAKDAGKSDTEIEAITVPKEELRFVADGVILK